MWNCWLLIVRLVLPVVRVSLSGSVFSPRTWCLVLRPDPSEVSMEAQGVYQFLQHGRTGLKPQTPCFLWRTSSSPTSAQSCRLSSCAFCWGPLCLPRAFTIGGRQSLDENLWEDFRASLLVGSPFFWDLPLLFSVALAALKSVLKCHKLNRQAFYLSPSYSVPHGLGSALLGKTVKMWVSPSGISSCIWQSLLIDAV